MKCTTPGCDNDAPGRHVTGDTVCHEHFWRAHQRERQEIDDWCTGLLNGMIRFTGKNARTA